MRPWELKGGRHRKKVLREKSELILELFFQVPSYFFVFI